MRSKIIILILAVMTAFAAVSCGKPDLSGEKGKYSYVIGYDVGTNMKRDNIELDVNAFAAAFEDGLKGKESRLTPEQAQQAMQNLMVSMQQKKMKGEEDSKNAGEAFLAENKKKSGVKTTASGLQYRVIKEGKGPRPKATDMVTAHYSGKLVSGTEFDSSYKRNQPAQFKLNEVIKGWSEGLQLMTAGSKYELVLPSDLGYGKTDNQGIPGNSVLIFEVELININK
jgi:FKBP-type peptidyl-prolyl cis-trans isomerase